MKILFFLIFSSAYSISIPITRYIDKENIEFYVTAEVGTPSQNVSLALSMDYSSILIPSIECSCYSQGDGFKSSESSSFYKNSTSAESSVTGSESIDTISINKFTVQDQQFVLVDKYNDIFEKQLGKLGLGFNSDPENAKSFIQRIESQGDLEKKIYAFYINRNVSEEKSQFIIGDFNSKNYAKGKKQEIGINLNNRLWMFLSSSSSFKEKSYESSYMRISLDSYIYGPSSVIDYIYKELSKGFGENCVEDSYFHCDQNDIDSYPNFIIKVDGEEDLVFEITPKNYFYKADYSRCKLLFRTSTDFYWTLGQPFLREYFSILDMEQSKLIFYRIDEVGDEDESSWTYAIIGGIIAVTLIIGGVVGWKCWCRNSQMSNSYTALS